MKNKRNAIIAFLLVAVLCLGIGYASVSDNLYINGTMDVDVDSGDFNTEFDADVYFSNVSIAGTANLTGENSAELVTAVIGDEDPAGADDIITVNVENGAFTAQNQTIVLTATVKNANATQSADVTVATPVCENGNFSVTINPAAEQTIAADGTQDYTITITLVNVPENDITDATFSITFTAVPTDMT